MFHDEDDEREAWSNALSDANSRAEPADQAPGWSSTVLSIIAVLLGIWMLAA